MLLPPMSAFTLLRVEPLTNSLSSLPLSIQKSFCLSFFPPSSPGLVLIFLPVSVLLPLVTVRLLGHSQTPVLAVDFWSRLRGVQVGRKAQKQQGNSPALNLLWPPVGPVASGSPNAGSLLFLSRSSDTAPSLFTLLCGSFPFANVHIQLSVLELLVPACFTTFLHKTFFLL